MNSKKWTSIVALTLFAALAIPVQLAAQENAKHHHQYHHYQLNDVGTFGGPQSWLWAPGLFRPGVLNNHGKLAGAADTSAVDPYCFWSPDCNAIHAFQWRNGVTTDLGVLPGGIGSQVSWIGNGLMAGVSDNGQQDPLNPAFPQLHAALWDHGQMTDLGTLPEGGYSSGSWAATVNNRGEVAGQAYNAIPDPNSMFPGSYGYQSRAFYWKNGVMQDLGTLYTGTDAAAGLINERGQVVGVSYLNSIPSAFCSGVGYPLTTGSFIWDKKNGMKDIGGFGGTCTVAYDLNSRGQVVGQSNHADDLDQHPFIWEPATGMIELPTAAGLYGASLAISDAGVVTGEGDLSDGLGGAMLWRKRDGKWHGTELGRLSGDCALGVSINSSGQVVGISGPFGCSTALAFLWEDGGPMVDLNTLVPPNSGLQLTEAQQVNDRGEIAVSALDANGNNHAVLLIPCDEGHRGVEGCDYSMVDAATAAAQSTARPYVPSATQYLPQSRWSNRYQMRGLQSARR